MLVHLRNNKQIAEYWPLFKEKINEYFPELVRKHPAYPNNILTHALTHSDSFQLCMYYDNSDMSKPHSLFILDIHKDMLKDCTEMHVVLWAGLFSASSFNVTKVAEELTEWAKGLGCKYLNASTFSKRIAEKEASILSKFCKKADCTFNLFCEL